MNIEPYGEKYHVFLDEHDLFFFEEFKQEWQILWKIQRQQGDLQ